MAVVPKVNKRRQRGKRLGKLAQVRSGKNELRGGDDSIQRIVRPSTPCRRKKSSAHSEGFKKLN